nr:MAG TPA: hypothetical protein [Caudoviricetes sp.]
MKYFTPLHPSSPQFTLLHLEFASTDVIVLSCKNRN